MKNRHSEPLPPHLLAELRALEGMTDDQIDYSDAPPADSMVGWVRRNRSDTVAQSLPRRIALPAPVASILEATVKLGEEYPDRKFTLDGHLVGSIGEIVAAKALGLTLYKSGKAGHDAFDDNGDVQIKMTGGHRVALYATCDRLVVLRIVSPHEAEIVYDGPGQPAWEQAGKMAKNGQRVVSIARLRKIAAALAA